MSGRIRSIKPELLEDAVTASLSDSAFRVFIAMILIADDYGNCRAEPKYLDGQIYWSAIPEKSVEEACKEDGMLKLITFYDVRGQRYAHINGWSKHQKVQHPGKPRVPAMSERDSGESHETLTKVPETLTPDHRPPITDHRPPSEGTAGDSHAHSSVTRLKSVPPPPADDTPEALAADLPEPEKPESGFDLARRVFAEEWQSKYRERYSFDFIDAGPQSENRVLQGLGAKALEHGDEAERWLRHVVKAYLRDKGRHDFLLEARHSAKFIGKSWQSYGNPPTGKHRVAARASPPAEPVAPALSAAEVAAKLAAAGIGKIGMGGGR